MNHLTRISTGFMAAAFCVVGVVAVQQGVKRGAGVGNPDTLARQREAFRLGGLRAAAAVGGGFVATSRRKTGSEPATLQELVHRSDVIVVGRIGRNLCVIAADESQIYTRFQVQVESVLKGALESGSISMILPGGRYTFDHGEWAQVNVPDLVRPVGGREYVLFLRRDVPGRIRGERGLPFLPVEGPLGIYGTDAKDKMAPAGAFMTRLGRDVLQRGLDMSTFVHAIEEMRAPEG